MPLIFKPRRHLVDYLDEYVSDMITGNRQTNRGTDFAPATIDVAKQLKTKILRFGEKNGRTIDFKDIDLNFYHEFVAFMKEEDNLSINTIGKYIGTLKTMLEAAESEGVNRFTAYRNKKFRATRQEVDSIYLTEDEVMKIIMADLSHLKPVYDQSRDLFLVGILIAQRVSDYGNLSRNNFHIDGDMVTVEFKQKKTGHKIVLPCSSALRKILLKYNYDLPHIWPQHFNDYIKVVGREAGIVEPVDIQVNNGGTTTIERVPKYKLITTHTALRTGATLMYLNGMDYWDIMKVTGHSTPTMLKKYIRADELDIARKLRSKYDFFK